MAAWLDTREHSVHCQNSLGTELATPLHTTRRFVHPLGQTKASALGTPATLVTRASRKTALPPLCPLSPQCLLFLLLFSFLSLCTYAVRLLVLASECDKKQLVGANAVACQRQRQRQNAGISSPDDRACLENPLAPIWKPCAILAMTLISKSLVPCRVMQMIQEPFHAVVRLRERTPNRQPQQRVSVMEPWSCAHAASVLPRRVCCRVHYLDYPGPSMTSDSVSVLSLSKSMGQ